MLPSLELIGVSILAQANKVSGVYKLAHELLEQLPNPIPKSISEFLRLRIW